MPHPEGSPEAPPTLTDAWDLFKESFLHGHKGLSSADGPPGAGLSAGPDPADVEFGGGQQGDALRHGEGVYDLSKPTFGLRDLMRLDAHLKAKQGSRDTRETRRHRRRATQGLADAEMLAEMGAGDKSGSDWNPTIREFMARAGMPNPQQAIREQYDNVMTAGQEMFGQAMDYGKSIPDRVRLGWEASAPYREQQSEENRRLIGQAMLNVLPEPASPPGLGRNQGDALANMKPQFEKLYGMDAMSSEPPPPGMMDRGLAAADEMGQDANAVMRESMARMGMPNPEQAIREQYDKLMEMIQAARMEKPAPNGE